MSRRRIQILDGSYGFQLNKHLEKPLDHDPLWSSKALITNPDAVIKTHMDYIQAGVDIIETNTYQASVMGFMKHLGISREESISLIEKAVEYAKIAISNCEKIGMKRPLVAGSVGPYGAYLHDGSEYTGSYMDFTTDRQLREYHESRIDALVRAGVDLLAIETIPSKKEASVLVDIVKKYPEVKVWVSFSCKMDGFSTASGDNFETTAVEIYKSNPSQIIAVGVNCLAPHIVESLIRNINADRDEPIPLIVYANSGENYNPTSGWDNNCEKLEEYIPTWLNLGVTIIGGCCRVCSDYIEKIKEEVVRWEEQQDSS
ncbi:betaine-homocysteine S-methyltransferase [Leptinotarsa decemlineata]|uniref:betaine-homocysteine S-methyltransferase n=1 Tax=Leptinotarsa decemlineata TaxID=7539 RepID=UPI003D304ACF